MKTLISLLVLSLLFNIQILSQRNPGVDRKTPGDRIDHVNVENPVRNPNPHREPIQEPQRKKEQQPIITYNPDPEFNQPICHPHPPIIYDPPPSECPTYYPPLPPITYNEPDLDNYSFDVEIPKTNDKAANTIMSCQPQKFIALKTSLNILDFNSF